MKRILITLAIFVLIGGIVFGLFNWLFILDLRSTDIEIEPDSNDKARAILLASAKAHGLDRWQKIKEYKVEFSDIFYGLVGKYGHPFREDSVGFTMQMKPGNLNGKMIVHYEEGDLGWSLADGVTTKFGLEKERDSADKDILFWMPTYQYFVEFPFRILEANKLAYLKEKLVDGKKCIGVLATWNTFETQRAIDQYIVWIDKETNYIHKLEYTIRELYGFLYGSLLYKDFKTLEGITFPTRMPVKSNLTPGLLHQMYIRDFNVISQG